MHRVRAGPAAGAGGRGREHARPATWRCSTSIWRASGAIRSPRSLSRRNVPFVFVTGYGANALPAEFADRPRVHKPFKMEELLAVLSSMVDRAAPADPPSAAAATLRIRAPLCSLQACRNTPHGRSRARFRLRSAGLDRSAGSFAFGRVAARYTCRRRFASRAGTRHEDRGGVPAGAARRAPGLGHGRGPDRRRDDPSGDARDGRRIRRLVRSASRPGLAGDRVAAGRPRPPGPMSRRRAPTTSAAWAGSFRRRRSSPPATSPTRRAMAT